MDYKDMNVSEITKLLEGQINMIRSIETDLMKGEDYIFKHRDEILHKTYMVGKYIDLPPLKMDKKPELREMKDVCVEEIDPIKNILGKITIDGKETNWYDILYKGLKSEMDVVENSIAITRIPEDPSKVGVIFYKEGSEISFRLDFDTNQAELLNYEEVEEAKDLLGKFKNLKSEYVKKANSGSLQKIEQALNEDTKTGFMNKAGDEIGFFDSFLLELRSNKSTLEKHKAKLKDKADSQIEEIKELEAKITKTKERLEELKVNIAKHSDSIRDQFNAVGIDVVFGDLDLEDIYRENLDIALNAKKDIKIKEGHEVKETHHSFKEKVEEATEDIKEDVKEKTEHAKDKAEEIKEDIKAEGEKIKHKFDDAKEDVKEEAEEIKEKTEDKVEEVKEKVEEKKDEVKKDKVERDKEKIEEKEEDLKEDKKEVKKEEEELK